ncbi:MAG: M48 family metalloprotease [Chitinophagales bacterium]|nr:M48 family metalloprotease [Chitinophagales bacterium]
MKSIVIFFCLTFLFACNGCKNEGFNIFSIEDDKQLGLQLQQEIAANPGDYPVLSETQYSAAYAHIYRMRDSILNSGNVDHKDDFTWEVKIIHDDATLNAFCAPGGYIYVYTGLIKFLDSEDQLAGVLGHEIAHADKRHSTQQLTKSYSISLLLQVVLGENAQLLSEIAQGLVSLKFSRSDESEADEYSVKYLCPTEYNAAGASGFFDKLIQLEQAGGTPQFLSTHPNPDNRVADINAHKTESGCAGAGTFDARYQQLKNSLP